MKCIAKTSEIRDVHLGLAAIPRIGMDSNPEGRHAIALAHGMHAHQGKAGLHAMVSHLGLLAPQGIEIVFLHVIALVHAIQGRQEKADLHAMVLAHAIAFRRVLLVLQGTEIVFLHGRALVHAILGLQEKVDPHGMVFHRALLVLQMTETAFPPETRAPPGAIGLLVIAFHLAKAVLQEAVASQVAVRHAMVFHPAKDALQEMAA